MIDLVEGVPDGLPDLMGALPVTLQQVESHALGGFGADAGQTLQRLLQNLDGTGIGHGVRRFRMAASYREC